jgi:methylenetetrahydrofolate dehydrogenase (NADP+) / methenyltetrahydrofolate cyclohydrolase
MKNLIDGKKLAKFYCDIIAKEVNVRVSQGKRRPGLAVILVGENQASKAYVGSKTKKATALGFESYQYSLGSDVSEKELLNLINQLNHDEKVDGILLQLPLPRGLDQTYLLNAISPFKDADGLHPLNQGKLFTGLYKHSFSPIPCTPFGIVKLIDLAYTTDSIIGDKEPVAIDLSGKKVVVVGRSTLVGKPLGILLLDKNATVTYAHSKSLNLSEITSQADILISAVGSANFIKKEHVKKEAVVIDVGINRNSSGGLIGDVKIDEIADKVKLITPVPGGVGPMTVAMLMWNTLQLSKNR